jgi:hypothetical protein
MLARYLPLYESLLLLSQSGSFVFLIFDWDVDDILVDQRIWPGLPCFKEIQIILCWAIWIHHNATIFIND